MVIVNLKDIFKKFGGAKLFFPLAGILILLVWGVSIFFTPSYEVMFNHQLLPAVPSGQGKLYVHILEVGNTGGNLQENVNILFSSNALSFQIMPLKIKNFGKVDRKVEITEDDVVTRIALGALAPEKRVEISIYLFYKDPDEIHEWDEIFKGIEIAQGKTVEGDPSWTTLGRILYGIFGSPF
jgi:hypothetical protein